MRLRTHSFMFVVAVLLLEAMGADAQRAPTGGVPTSTTVVVRVQAPDGGPLDQSADVGLSKRSEGSPTHQLTRDAGEAEFENVSGGIYYVAVTALGYKLGGEEVEVPGLGGDVQQLT